MRINYEKYPVLEMLDNISLGKVGLSEDDFKIIGQQGLYELNDCFKQHAPFFKQSIRYVSSTLAECMRSAEDKLMKTENLLDLESGSGTILLPDGKAFFYNIITKSGEDDWQYIILFFSGRHLISFSYSPGLGKSSIHFMSNIHTPKDIIITAQDRREMAKKTQKDLVLILMFIKYAEIETKFLPPSRQIYEGVNCLYNNKSKYPIEIIDSTWFTTLIKSDAFKVRGHFRLQPFGEGLSKRRLVWINDFQKNGYTRKAKKAVLLDSENG